MGQNLILNAADHGFTVCAYNRTTSKVDRFLENEAKGKLPSPLHRRKKLPTRVKLTDGLQASPSLVLTPFRSSLLSSSAPAV